MKHVHIACVLVAVAASGCATKRYPMATALSPALADAMDCRELELELIESEDVRRQIGDTAEMDWRSAAGFLGDFGIGNSMAKNEAEASLDDRIGTIRAAQVEKNCLASAA